MKKFQRATEYGKARAAECLAMLDHKTEKSPWGRNWNREIAPDEKLFWLQAANQPEKLHRKMWGELPPETRFHLERVWRKCAARAKFILQDTETAQ